ncbi:MAG: HAMP domain-containing histidine kinase [Chlorobia bacterium]|nr:HAMP domain-containing histidine kinase [Fimbriimonadaceae bacterium]
MRGPTLAEFIRASIEQILAEWDEFAKSCSPAADSLTPRELGDHAKQMLNWIADDLETSQTRSEQAEKSKGLADETTGESAASKHGAIRFNDQFTLSQVFAEFRALRASVIRLWSRGRSITDTSELLELIRFNEAIDQAVAESVQRFSAGLEESRDIFIAILGHDLRNPLSAIMTGAEYLKRTLPPRSDAEEVATSIHNSAVRMNLLIRDLLDVSRKRLGGDFPMSIGEMELDAVCRKVIDETSRGERGAPIRFETSGNSEGQWDRERMAQVVSNLVGNAIQHGASGTPITVTVQGNGEVLLIVHNWGEVIPPAALQEIFEPTKRLKSDREEERSRGSLGLGLYIVDLIVGAHGGHIDVTSTKELGTTFTVHLPRAQTARVPEGHVLSAG